MNILHIDEQRTWRGGEQQASYLIQGLVRRGHTCLLAGKPGTPFFMVDHGVTDLMRVAAPFRGEADLQTAWVLARAVKQYNIDIIHAHSSHAHTMACLARMMAGRSKVVVHRRVDFAPNNSFVSRWKYSLPDHFIAVCRRVAEVLHAFGISPEKVSVVYSAIDLSRFEVEPISRADLGLPENTPLLGNVAALVGHKDHANLLDAMPEALRELPDLHLVIAGEGELRSAIEAQIRRLGLDKLVTLLGHRTDVQRILRAIDAFVLSSYAEGIGGCVLEALACARPVVATDAGGVGEVIRNEQTGLLVPARDPAALAKAVIRVFRDRPLATALANRGHALVREQFTVDTMVDKVLQVYDRLFP